MVVTGDRDAYQLVDDGVRIMTTSRGITDTRVYDREGVVDRYGIPPELVPDFIGLKGDTSRQHPGRPGHRRQDRRRSCSSEFGSLEDVLGARRRDQRRQAQAEPHRARRRRPDLQAARHAPSATSRSDVDLGRGLDASPTARGCARCSAQFELRDPLRRLEEALGSAEDAAPAAAERRRGAHRDAARGRAAGRRAACAARRSRWPCARPRRPRARCSPTGSRGASRAYAGGARACWSATPTAPRRVVAALGDRPVVAHDAKALGDRARATSPRHDGRRLPARAGAPRLPVRRARRGARARRRASTTPPAARRAARRARSPPGSARRSRERGLESLLDDVELPLVRVLREMEQAGLQARHRPAGDDLARACKAEADELEREIFELAGEEFTIGSPQQLAEILFGKLGLSRKRRGKTGLLDRRARAAGDPRRARDHPQDRALARADQARPDLPRRAARADRRRDGRLHTTFNQTAATTGRLSSTNPNLQNIPIRTELGREIRGLLRRRAGQRAARRADYSQVELRILAHIAGEDGAQGDLPPRRGRAHRDGDARCSASPPEQIDPAMRSKAKMINYGIVYGLSAYGMADRLDIPQEEARGVHRRATWRASRRCRRSSSETIEQATEHGYVSTLFGRRRQIPELRARAGRCASWASAWPSTWSSRARRPTS